MRKLGLCSIVLYLLAVLLVSGGFATVSAKGKTDICHFDKDSGTWKLIAVGNPAVAAHFRNHDDGYPGGTTEQSGTELDENCEPASQPAFVCPPEDGAGFALGDHNADNDILFCSYPAFEGEDPLDFYCTYDATDGHLVADQDVGFCPANAVLE